MYLAWILWPTTQFLGAEVMTALRFDAPAVAESSMSLFDLLGALQASVINLSSFDSLDLAFEALALPLPLEHSVVLALALALVLALALPDPPCCCVSSDASRETIQMN
eukprot:FR743534.1.p1 GENE.FR743534.1~~FR743534.1.p1  ORF type:complete len:108 (-),score=9.72 FR743534.1:61-384(-)